MSGVMRESAAPETPFLTSEGGVLVNPTPVVKKRFKVLKSDTEDQDSS